MRATLTSIYYPRFRTLLLLVLVLNVTIFVLLNVFIHHDKDKLDSDSSNFIIQVFKSDKSNEDFNSEKIKWSPELDVNQKTFSNQDENESLPEGKDEDDDDDNDDDHGDSEDDDDNDDDGHDDDNNDNAVNDENDNTNIEDGRDDESDDGDDDDEEAEEQLQQQLNTENITYDTQKTEPEGVQNVPPDLKETNPSSHSPTDKYAPLPTINSSNNAISPEHVAQTDKEYTENNHSNSREKDISNVAEPVPTTKKPLTQEVLNRIANDMEARFEVLADIRKAVVTLRNKGIAPIDDNRWSVHFCITNGMELDHLVHRPGGYILPNKTSIKLTHFNGCAYKLEPTKDFKAILPGDSLEFMVNIGATLAMTDLGPRWYVAAEGLQPRVISNTAGESLDFVFLPNRKRSWDRFVHNDVIDLEKAPLLVIPTPLEIVGLDESKKIHIDSEWVVFGELELESEAMFLADKLQLQKSLSQTASTKVIKLRLGEVQLVTPKDQDTSSNQSSKESYQLIVDVTKEVITITGTGKAGAFYGAQTLLALMDNQGLVPQVSIKDSPRFSYRGLMVDVARNFQPKQEIMKLLDVMAMYKMNKFHFHLSDNEGWRLEIPGLEELTLVGAKRCYDEKEKTCILSQLGSGPDTSTSGTGHYSTEDYRDILRHAAQRHIQVIPEFDFPGHSHAAIKSMIARHDRLLQEGKEKEAKQFLLNDFQDESRYLSVQAFTDETATCCLNSTYALIESILRVSVNLHHDIQPLTVYHFGGDEVPGGAWQKSPACEKLAKILNIPYRSIHTHKLLKEYFLQRLSNITAKMNVNIAGWGDFLFERKTETVLPREFFSNQEVYSFAWSTTGAAKHHHEVPLMANHGYKVVLSNPDYIYLDHPYEPDPEERGKYWATPFTDTRKIFSYMPESLYEDIEQMRNCTGLKRCVDGRQNVLGVEAAVWVETIRTPDHMFTMIFPRLLALAERAWHKAPWEDIHDSRARDREKTGDWVKFANTLGYKELHRLDKMNVPYHVTPPGARLLGKKLETRAAMPGLKVEYSTNDGVTWNDVTGGTEIDGKVQLRTRCADGKRVSREVEIEPPKPKAVEDKNDEIVLAPEAESKRDKQTEDNHSNNKLKEEEHHQDNDNTNDSENDKSTDRNSENDNNNNESKIEDDKDTNNNNDKDNSNDNGDDNDNNSDNDNGIDNDNENDNDNDTDNESDSDNGINDENDNDNDNDNVNGDRNDNGNDNNYDNDNSKGNDNDNDNVNKYYNAKEW